MTRRNPHTELEVLLAKGIQSATSRDGMDPKAVAMALKVVEDSRLYERYVKVENSIAATLNKFLGIEICRDSAVGWSAWEYRPGQGVPFTQHPELSPVWVRLIRTFVPNEIRSPEWLLDWIEERITTEELVRKWEAI